MADNVLELLIRATDEASSQIEHVGDKLGELGEHAEFAKRALEGIAAAFTLGEMLSTIEHAQDAVARLDIMFQNAAGTVGVTREEMDSYAEGLSKVSTYSEIAVKSTEALLLRFNNVRGAQFGEALKASADLAAASGSDIESTALRLGRALQNPANGMMMLQRMGVTLTDTQKAQVNSFLELNNVVAAQEVILGRVRESFNGAAEAMTHTLGGALSQLKNAFEETFELPRDQTQPLIDSVNRLKDAVADPKFKQAVVDVTKAMVDGLAAVVPWIEKVAEGWAKLIPYVAHPIDASAQLSRDKSYQAESNALNEGLNTAVGAYDRDVDRVRRYGSSAGPGHGNLTPETDPATVEAKRVVQTWVDAINEFDARVNKQLAPTLAAAKTDESKRTFGSKPNDQGEWGETYKEIEEKYTAAHPALEADRGQTEQSKKLQEQETQERIKAEEAVALAVLATDAALAKSQNELGLTTKAQELQQEQENADKVFQVKVKALEEWLSYQRAHHALPSEQDKTAAALGQLQVQYAGETATRSVAMGTEAGRGQQETDKQLAAISDKFDSPLTKVRSEYAEYMSYLSEAYNNALAAADAATTAGQEKIALLHATIMRVTAEEADAVRKAQSTMGSEDAQKAAGDIRSLWDTTFEHINKGTRGMVDAFASAFESILNKALATDLWNALGLDKILGGSTGGAGVLNNLFSGISGILGGLFTSSPAVAQGVAGDAATSAASGVVGSVLSGIGAAFFAGGGVTPGGLTMVGEEGPELVNLPSGSHVYSNSQSSDMLSASGGGATLHFSPVNNVNITANDADETRAQLIAYIDYTNKQQQKELYRTMQRNGLGSMR